MMETSLSLLEAIKQALQDEAVGKAIYEKAAKNAENNEIKNFFLKMAHEEESHIDYLNRLYKRLDKKLSDNELLQDVRHNFKPNKEIFDKNFLDGIAKNKSLLLALNTSATLEKNAIAFYKKCQNIAVEKDLKDFFDAMVIWETDHLNKILDIFENIDDEDMAISRDEYI